jgi:hypothetical protein
MRRLIFLRLWVVVGNSWNWLYSLPESLYVKEPRINPVYKILYKIKLYFQTLNHRHEKYNQFSTLSANRL